MVELGYGKHIWDFDQANVPQWMLLSNCRTTFTVVAACWSKTSFGITLTRITDGWTKRFIYILLVSMNIFLGLSGLFPWVNCTPIKKSWSPFTEGTCWPSKTLVHYNIFSGGRRIVVSIRPRHLHLTSFKHTRRPATLFSLSYHGRCCGLSEWQCGRSSVLV